MNNMERFSFFVGLFAVLAFTQMEPDLHALFVALAAASNLTLAIPRSKP